MQTGKITHGVAYKILDLLIERGKLSPRGRQYTIHMVRNWLYEYGKGDDPNIKQAYLEVVAADKASGMTKEKQRKVEEYLKKVEELLA